MSPYIAIMALFNGCLLWLVTGFPMPPVRDVMIVVISGMLTAIGALLYYRALSIEETSKVIVLIQIQPVIILILSFLVLHETITVIQFVGFVLILGSAVVLAAWDGRNSVFESLLAAADGEFSVGAVGDFVQICSYRWSL